MKTRMQVAVKALFVNDDGDVLLLRRSSGDTFGADAWDTPGGRIRFGESVEAALRREVFEETGMKDFRVTKILTAWSLLKNEFTQLVGITFLCEYGDEEIRLSHEHAGYEWVSPSQMLEANKAPPPLQDSLRAFVDDCSPMRTSETQA
jgi:8-oxo-dGTP diphosphatase